MKVYSKEECKKLANEVFDFNKEASKVTVTKDGQVFFAEKENAILNHVRTKFGNEAKVKDSTYTFERGGELSGDEGEIEVDSTGKTSNKTDQELWADKTVSDVKDDVKKINSVDQLNVIKDWVDTKGGKAAIDERITELEKPAGGSEGADESTGDAGNDEPNDDNGTDGGSEDKKE